MTKMYDTWKLTCCKCNGDIHLLRRDSDDDCFSATCMKCGYVNKITVVYTTKPIAENKDCKY